MLDVQIRKADAEDAEGLADFMREMNYFRRFEGLSPERVRAQVRAALEGCLAEPGHSVYVALGDNGDFVAYTSVHWLPYLFLPGPEGYISELFVAAPARGQGIGTRLLEAVKAEAVGRKCSRLSLLNMRDRESYQRAFYAKDGWQERDDAANFIFDMGTPATS